MATNNFKPFALDPNANVTSQADWEALPALLSGFTAGKASSAQVNKAIRQATFIAAALAQYTANKSGLDVLDDGDVSGFIAKMTTALGKDFQGLDATLTALAGLATGANKLPYFTGTDTASQTDLTSVGRDIIGKSTIADILTYLGLGDGSGRLIGVRVITSSGTYTPTPGTKSVVVEVQGGGGAGGAAGTPPSGNIAMGGGGAAGAYARSRLTAGFSGVQITIGAGGRGRKPDYTGMNGGNSSFGTITAAGGNGGPAVGATPPFIITAVGGATASGGNIVSITGSSSLTGIAISASYVSSGTGGSSPLGSGGGPRSTTIAGDNASGFGSGGSGALNLPGATGDLLGGDGSDGVVIVWEYA
ncbi:hypothetical protein NU286_08620 [Escherichia coli]|uniref:glycine-rich domain-containing protein n=1 Tax=Escherichia coli TaxID=562 RepID=UPI00215166B1|nr:hypothetical protein [Escherichia coli]MCR6183402.1 hypothetical protein [Escherichia coli]